jgi:hypothetical protein
MTTKELLTKLRAWAADRRCSCRGRLHDPQDLMGELLEWCQDMEKQLADDDHLVKTSDELPKLEKGQRQKLYKERIIELAEKVKEILIKEGRWP